MDTVRNDYTRGLGLGFAISVVLLVFSSAACAQDDRATGISAKDQAFLDEFSRQSAAELIAKYFQSPPYSLFVLHWLVDLGDPSAVPALRAAFARDPNPITREFLASALVRLGEKEPR